MPANCGANLRENAYRSNVKRTDLPQLPSRAGESSGDRQVVACSGPRTSHEWVNPFRSQSSACVQKARTRNAFTFFLRSSMASRLRLVRRGIRIPDFVTRPRRCFQYYPQLRGSMTPPGKQTVLSAERREREFSPLT